MTNEENKDLEPTVDESQEQAQGEDDSNDIPTLEDYERIRKENETLKAQKEHWKKKATVLKEPDNKTNNTPGLSREDAILFAKGHTEEEVALANKLAAINWVPVLKAIEDELFISKVEKRKQEELSAKASLPASGNSSFAAPAKPVSAMEKDEHIEYFHKMMWN